MSIIFLWAKNYNGEPYNKYNPLTTKTLNSVRVTTARKPICSLNKRELYAWKSSQSAMSKHCWLWSKKWNKNFSQTNSSASAITNERQWHKEFGGSWCQPAGPMLNGNTGLWLTSHIITQCCPVTSTPSCRAVILKYSPIDRIDN